MAPLTLLRCPSSWCLTASTAGSRATTGATSYSGSLSVSLGRWVGVGGGGRGGGGRNIWLLFCGIGRAGGGMEGQGGRMFHPILALILCCGAGATSGGRMGGWLVGHARVGRGQLPSSFHDASRGRKLPIRPQIRGDVLVDAAGTISARLSSPRIPPALPCSPSLPVILTFPPVPPCSPSRCSSTTMTT